MFVTLDHQVDLFVKKRRVDKRNASNSNKLDLASMQACSFFMRACEYSFFITSTFPCLPKQKLRCCRHNNVALGQHNTKSGLNTLLPGLAP
jgi:hypothetical protein